MHLPRLASDLSICGRRRSALHCFSGDCSCLSFISFSSGLGVFPLRVSAFSSSFLSRFIRGKCLRLDLPKNVLPLPTGMTMCLDMGCEDRKDVPEPFEEVLLVTRSPGPLRLWGLRVTVWIWRLWAVQSGGNLGSHDFG